MPLTSRGRSSKGHRPKTSQAFRDMVIIFLATILVYEVSFIYDLFEPLYETTRDYNAWQIDEFFIIFSFITAAFLVFALRRWKELQREIGRRERLEDYLSHTQKIEAVGILAGGLAHNFNNILAGILGYSAAIKQKCSSDSRAIAEVNAIDKLARDGANLTQALLTFARRGRYNPSLLDVNRVIGDALTVVERTVGKGIDIRAELTPGLLNIFGDENQVHQVVINLLLNACQAMPGGGRLLVRTVNAHPDRGFFEVHPGVKNGPFITITVSDSGVGIDARTRRHIFEPFFTTKDPESATGLGLAVVNGIVERHGGCIDVETAQGDGSAFHVYLPAVRGVRGEAREENAAHSGRGATILVIDDDEDFRNGVVRGLKQAGYTVFEAAGGEEALKRLAVDGASAAAVLLDAQLKGMSGPETLKKIRDMVPGLPAIICTGGLLDEVSRQMLEEGGCDFIQKPFDFKSLELKILDIIDGD